ncbi:Uncharacterised protein [Streptococcus pneumoniae]|nr:Uncharacterised protein [Streptococcus pneumoniae]
MVFRLGVNNWGSLDRYKSSSFLDSWSFSFLVALIRLIVLDNRFDSMYSNSSAQSKIEFT